MIGRNVFTLVLRRGGYGLGMLGEPSMWVSLSNNNGCEMRTVFQPIRVFKEY